MSTLVSPSPASVPPPKGVQDLSSNSQSDMMPSIVTPTAIDYAAPESLSVRSSSCTLFSDPGGSLCRTLPFSRSTTPADLSSSFEALLPAFIRSLLSYISLLISFFFGPLLDSKDSTNSSATQIIRPGSVPLSKSDPESSNHTFGNSHSVP
jgi:hypothetical protein